MKIGTDICLLKFVKITFVKKIQKRQSGGEMMLLEKQVNEFDFNRMIMGHRVHSILENHCPRQRRME